MLSLHEKTTRKLKFIVNLCSLPDTAHCALAHVSGLISMYLLYVLISLLYPLFENVYNIENKVKHLPNEPNNEH